MTKEQLLSILAILAVLSAAIQQFYALKAEVDTLIVRFNYVQGTNWAVPPPGAK